MARDELAQLEGPADGDDREGAGGSNEDGSSVEGSSVPIPALREPSEAKPGPSLSEPPAVQDAVPDEGLVRVVHASTSGPVVDFYRTGQPVPMAIDLLYGTASGYVAVKPGTHTFDLRTADAAPDVAPLVTSETVTVEPGERWTFVVAGGSVEPQTLRMVPVRESLAPAAPGMARLGIVHAGVDAPPLGFDVGDDGSPDVPELSRFDVAGAGIVLETEARGELGVYAGDARLTGFSLPPSDDGAELLAVATGELSSLPREESTFSLLVVKSNGSTLFVRQDPFVYTLHGSPDVGTVDIYAGDVELADSVDFGELVEHQLSPGTYALDVFEARPGIHPRPEADPVAVGRVEAFAPGNTYLVAFTPPGPDTTGSDIRVHRYVEDFMLGDDENARVRWVHAAADLDALDIGTAEAFGTAAPPLLAEGLTFAQATSPHGTVVAPGDVTLGIGAAGQTAVLARFSDVPFYPGDRMIGFVTRSRTSADAPNPLGLLLIDTSACPPSGAWSVAHLESG